MVKVGLIGIGFMGSTHFQIHKDHRKSKVVAIADHRKEKLEGDWSSIGGNIGSGDKSLVDLKGINTYLDPFELIKDPNVDLVDICLPTDKHAEVAIAALKAGKHVFLEKPMAISVKAGEELAKTAARAKGFFMVGHCIRFWPEYQVTYDMIKSGKYGKIREVSLRRVSSPPGYSDENWLLKSKRSGGGILDLHIHDVDFALYLCGKPKKVWAWGRKGVSGGIDTIYAGYEYPGGVHASVVGGWGYHPPFPFNMEFNIQTDKATFVYNMASGKPLKIYTDTGKVLEPKMPAGSGWSRELNYFINCIEKKQKPTIVTAKTSLDSLKMVETELESVRTGKAVVPKK